VHENEFVLLFALICLINYIYAIASPTVRFLFLLLFHNSVRHKEEGEKVGGCHSVVILPTLPGGNLSIGCAGNQINNEAAAKLLPSAAVTAGVAVAVAVAVASDVDVVNFNCV